MATHRNDWTLLLYEVSFGSVRVISTEVEQASSLCGEYLYCQDMVFTEPCINSPILGQFPCNEHFGSHHHENDQLDLSIVLLFETVRVTDPRVCTVLVTVLVMRIQIELLYLLVEPCSAQVYDTRYILTRI